jgi:hypothetical protein
LSPSLNDFDSALIAILVPDSNSRLLMRRLHAALPEKPLARRGEHYNNFAVRRRT